MAKIIKSIVKVEHRHPGKSGVVVGEHLWDDDVVWPVVVTVLAGEDAHARLEALIPGREEDRSRHEEAAEQAKREAQEVDRLMEKAMAGLSHEEAELVRQHRGPGQ